MRYDYYGLECVCVGGYAIVFYFKVLFQHSFGRTEENQEKKIKTRSAPAEI
jgi:hypothetical protein